MSLLPLALDVHSQGHCGQVKKYFCKVSNIIFIVFSVSISIGRGEGGEIPYITYGHVWVSDDFCLSRSFFVGGFLALDCHRENDAPALGPLAAGLKQQHPFLLY